MNLSIPVMPSLPQRPTLRSCLSPPRAPSQESMSSACSSRSTSFSSVKSVRWQEQPEGEPVTAYHPTWSKAEYDRTPLDPPSDAERNCVFPERDARCIRLDIPSSPTSPSSPVFPSFSHSRSTPQTPHPGMIMAQLPITFEDDAIESTPDTPIARQMNPQQYTSSESPDECDDGDSDWEECMARRRMMFASMCGAKLPQPEFDGYRSMSTALSEMLHSMDVQKWGERDDHVIENDDNDHGEEQGENSKVDGLRNLEGYYGDVETHTPSLSSAESSEEECVLESPKLNSRGTDHRGGCGRDDVGKSGLIGVL
ncbi:hypothetical protein M231_07739 [Tremella mesenterica]|uniref:Uncharacterized protein n=1 Tax=Tremella mesenterica TaxID=5217 RepID=A0A4Q1B8E3_TREME|nr:uncharacterized protein TREMEDRAFT_74704 [Tremella mesenterica DSM 1558]EIW66453.1 hypothetical protein TREMEDRAFT_74704 [Tremella mesenterica DSM 1558]RXK35009.1 hypothetical protein M231_07739 [Tremella mesenterica]